MIEDSNLGGNGMKTNDEALLKIKYDVLRTVSKLAFEGKLEEERDNIPFKLIPGPKAQFRCCVYKEREIIRQRVRLAEGKCPSDKQSDNIIQVISSACEECPITRFVVTDNCQKCMGKACQNACNFGAISIGRDRAHIDPSVCKECGRCAQACPYNAIAELIRPCRRACPVDAITMDPETGICQIDEKKCIQCGACVRSCPFGAISSKVYVVQVIEAIKAGKKVVAMVAPAAEGEFGQDITMESWRTALKKVGFADMVEVAAGADMTAAYEAMEWAEAQRNTRKRRCRIPASDGTTRVCRDRSCYGCPMASEDHITSETVSLDAIMENSNKKAAIGDVTSAEAMKNLEEEEFIAFLEQHYPKCAKVYKKDKVGFTTAEIADSLGLSDRMIRYYKNKIDELHKQFAAE